LASWAQGPGLRVQGPGFRVQNSGSRVQGPGFKVDGQGFAVQGSRLRVQVSGCRHLGVRMPQNNFLRVLSPDPRLKCLGFTV